MADTAATTDATATDAKAPAKGRHAAPAERSEADVRRDIAAANDALLAADWKLARLGDELLTYAKYDDATAETLRVEHERALQAAWRAHFALIAHLRGEYRAARDARRGGGKHAA